MQNAENPGSCSLGWKAYNGTHRLDYRSQGTLCSSRSGESIFVKLPRKSYFSWRWGERDSRAPLLRYSPACGDASLSPRVRTPGAAQHHPHCRSCIVPQRGWSVHSIPAFHYWSLKAFRERLRGPSSTVSIHSSILGTYEMAIHPFFILLAETEPLRVGHQVYPIHITCILHSIPYLFAT